MCDKNYHLVFQIDALSSGSFLFHFLFISSQQKKEVRKRLTFAFEVLNIRKEINHCMIFYTEAQMLIVVNNNRCFHRH